MGKRILMVIDHYPPIQGGAERQTQRLSQLLVKRGYEVSVATVWHAGQPEYEDDEGVQVYRIKGLTTRIPWFFEVPDWRRHPPPFPDPGLVLGLRQLIKRFQPDLVQVYGWIVYSCALALLGKDIPMIVSSRDYGYSCANRYLIRQERLCDGPGAFKCIACARDYYRFPKAVAAVLGIYSGRPLLIRKTGAFHSVSYFVQQMVRRDLLHNSKRVDIRKPNVVIHNLFSNPDRLAEPSDLARLPDVPFILYVGTLDHRKGMNVLLEAYATLDSPPPLVLMGITAPTTPEVFPEGITVLHDVPHAAVMAGWKRCLFGVVPSLWPDSLPNVVLEGMSQGKAIVGTRAGGIPDMVVDGETGLLVAPADARALAAAMKQMIDHDAFREECGRAGLERIKLFSPDTILPEYEKLYHRLGARKTNYANTDISPLG